MDQEQFISRGRLEQHINAARQLRAETVAGRVRLSNPLTGIRNLLRNLAAVIASLLPRKT